MFKRYEIRALGDLADVLKAEGRETYWTEVASDLPSAWRKFSTRRFGVLKPNPSDYDVHFLSVVGPSP